MIGKIGMFILAWVGLSFLAGGLYALVNYLDYRRRERQLKMVTGRYYSCSSNCKEVSKEEPRGAVPLDRTATTKEFTPYRKKEPRS